MPQGKRKRWLWLLLIPGIPAAVLVVVFLLFALIAGSHVVGAFVDPVNVWNSTSKMPAEADVEGHYKLSKPEVMNAGNSTVRIPDDSGFILRTNHELEIHDLPKFDGFGSFAVLGRSKPYRFWYYIGDPDSGQGLLYESR